MTPKVNGSGPETSVNEGLDLMVEEVVVHARSVDKDDQTCVRRATRPHMKRASLSVEDEGCDGWLAAHLVSIGAGRGRSWAVRGAPWRLRFEIRLDTRLLLPPSPG